MAEKIDFKADDHIRIKVKPLIPGGEPAEEIVRYERAVVVGFAKEPQGPVSPQLGEKQDYTGWKIVTPVGAFPIVTEVFRYEKLQPEVTGKKCHDCDKCVCHGNDEE